MTHDIGSVTFQCGVCDTTIAIDLLNPPKDDEAVTCGQCGQLFGFYGLLKERLKAEADVEARKWFDETFGGKSSK